MCLCMVERRFHGLICQHGVTDCIKGARALQPIKLGLTGMKGLISIDRDRFYWLIMVTHQLLGDDKIGVIALNRFSVHREGCSLR